MLFWLYELLGVVMGKSKLVFESSRIHDFMCTFWEILAYTLTALTVVKQTTYFHASVQLDTTMHITMIYNFLFALFV